MSILKIPQPLTSAAAVTLLEGSFLAPAFASITFFGLTCSQFPQGTWSNPALMTPPPGAGLEVAQLQEN